MTTCTPKGRPFAVGHDARRSVRSTGRPPDEWKRQLAALVTRNATLAHVRTVLDVGPDHPHFFRALTYATDYGIGRPTHTVDVTTAGQPITVITGVPVSDEYTPAYRLPSPDHTGAH